MDISLWVKIALVAALMIGIFWDLVLRIITDAFKALPGQFANWLAYKRSFIFKKA